MRLSLLLGLLVVVCATVHAGEQDACAECKNSALADASQCQAIAAPDPALRDRCDKDFAQATRACAASACKAEADMLSAAHCSDCLKQVEGETKKCASLPTAVRAACEARVAIARKSCEDKACAAAKPK